MIIIERHYDTKTGRGGPSLNHHVEKKVFNDDDIEGVEKFINEDGEGEPYEWIGLTYIYKKL